MNINYINNFANVKNDVFEVIRPRSGSSNGCIRSGSKDISLAK